MLNRTKEFKVKGTLLWISRSISSFCKWVKWVDTDKAHMARVGVYRSNLSATWNYMYPKYKEINTQDTPGSLI